MVEKRKAVRRYLYNYSRVFDRKSNKMTGRIVNITRDGMMVMCEMPIKKNSSFGFRMTLPAGINLPGEKTIDFDGGCRWCRQSNDPDYYETGFEFSDVPESSRNTIDFLMRYHSFSY